MGTPSRVDVLSSDCWNLDPLYLTVSDWEEDYRKLETIFPNLSAFEGKLASSAEALLEAIELYLSCNRQLEKLYVFAHLRSDEDTSDASALALLDKASNLYARVSATASFITPELLSIPDATLQAYLNDPKFQPYFRMIEEIVRYKPHTLTKSEENLLAMGSEVLASSGRIFSQLNNADLSFPALEIDGEKRELTHGSYSLFLKDRRREVREAAFSNYYSVFAAHKNTLAASLAASVKRDVFLAQARKFPSCLKRALFSDNIAQDVYDALIQNVRKGLAPLHRYYQLRKDVLGLEEQRVFDTYVPLIADCKVHHTYDQAVTVLLEALAPLGEEYVSVLKRGVTTERWVDRYENKGKRMGAYSSGCYDSPPYMLLNYKDEDLHELFTFAHEAGHSMHSYFSNKHQPYQDHGYTIFVAEVASTFNEQLLLAHLRKQYAHDPVMQAYLINHQIDDIKATFYRQTMFAQFEKHIHEVAEANQALTVETISEPYAALLREYFGPSLTFKEYEQLEAFRIPHFYSAFYVYKYATGLAAAIALSQKVLRGEAGATEHYLRFLSSGGSKYPLELLRDAGVDMTSSEPVEATVSLFASLVEDLENVKAQLGAK